MGLKDAKYTDEEIYGIGVEHDTDRMIDKFFDDNRKDKKAIKLAKIDEISKKGISKEASQDENLLSVKTFGFDDNGVLKHNMPCPVCLKTQAIYVNEDGYSFFSPCKKCQEKGFVLENSNNKSWFKK